MQILKVRSKSREEIIDITQEVSKLLPLDGKGICFLFVQHTTCGLTVNENADPDVPRDILLFLKKMVPRFFEGFSHFEGNSDAHIKASLIGSSVMIPFQNGKLLLGKWQGIFLCEFDGARERSVVVKILKDLS